MPQAPPQSGRFFVSNAPAVRFRRAAIPSPLGQSPMIERLAVFEQKPITAARSDRTCGNPIVEPDPPESPLRALPYFGNDAPFHREVSAKPVSFR